MAGLYPPPTPLCPHLARSLDERASQEDARTLCRLSFAPSQFSTQFFPVVVGGASGSPPHRLHVGLLWLGPDPTARVGGASATPT